MTAPSSLQPPVREWRADHLRVSLYPDEQAMGRAAAAFVADYLEKESHGHEPLRVVFACAPSQLAFLEALTSEPLRAKVPWAAMEVFHMDDYVGMPADDPRSFRHFLQRHLLGKVEVRASHLLPAEQADLESACRDYAELLNAAPIDLVCMGIGENGHVAFNDPPVADFEDPYSVKAVQLDPACRQQQVNDGCFPDLESVPTHALTLTIPVFRKARCLSCVVPRASKARAVEAVFSEPVSAVWPATLLREHPMARLFLDPPAASRVSG